jgi:hypothetical protein
MTDGPSPTLFLDTINAFQKTEALRAALELDLFTHVSTGKATADQLAAACGAHPRGVRILADYLTVLGFLTKGPAGYAVAPESAPFVVRTSPAYMGGTVGFLLMPEVRDCFAKLTDAVRKGGTAHSAEGTVSHDNPVWVPFAREMAALMRLPAVLLSQLVEVDATKPLRILDVAAGHGLFGLAVAQKHPAAHVTALDWPNVLQVAEENARAANVSARYALLPGSAFEVDWSGPYDLVLLTNFLHHFDLPACAAIARKARAALAPGGRCVTLEFVPNADRVSPPPTATFALTMLATTARGDAYTFAEYEALFARAGFARSTFHPLPPSAQQAVVSYT